MKFRIHFTVAGHDGQDYDDSIVVIGDDLEEIRAQAVAEVERRGGVDPWSEEIV